MRRLLSIFILLLLSERGYSFSRIVSGGHATFTTDAGLHDDALLNDAQDAIDNTTNPIVTGDTLYINATGTEIWHNTLFFGTGGHGGAGQNITIKGNGKGDGPTFTRLVREGSSTSLLDIKVNDLDTPFILRDIQFYGENTNQFRVVDGVTTIRKVASQWTGGLIIYNARFASQTDHTFHDGQTYSTKRFTSASAQFIPSDVGTRTIVCPGVPSGTKVATWVSKTEVTLTNAATATASGLDFTVLARTDAGTPGNKIAFANCYVEGVMFHSEYDDNPVRPTAETAQINMSINPITGNGKWGDYVQAQPSPTGDLAGTIHAFVFQDCVFKHTGGVNDTGGGIINNGGAVFQGNHLTQIGSQLVTHGFGETGGGSFAARLQELYNNHYCYQIGWPKFDYAGAEGRSAEALVYNNYMTTVGSGSLSDAKRHFSSVSYFRQSYVSNSRLYYGPDALNPLDENWKGDAQDMPYRLTGNNGDLLTTPLTFKHYIATGYSNDTIVSGSIPTSDNKDHVSSGVDSDSRFGDVYGYADVAGITANKANNTVNGVNIQGTFPTGADVTASHTDDFWRGFVIRNNKHDRSDVGEPTPFTYILHSHYNGTTTDLNVMRNQLGAGGGHGPIDVTTAGSKLEFRRVKTYFTAPGAGPVAKQIRDDSNPLDYTGLSPATPNPRWVGQIAAGVWMWGNMYRQCATLTGPAGAWTPEIKLNLASTGGDNKGGDHELVTREFHQIRADSSTIDSANTKPGYPWNKSSSGTAANIVGADYTAVFSDGITNTGNWASFPHTGSGGYTVDTGDRVTYPHPLRALITPPAGNVISVSGPSTVIGGNKASFVISDSSTPVGNVTVNFTFGGGSAVAGTHFTAPTSPATITGGTNSTTVDVQTTSLPGTVDKTATFHLSSTSGSGSPTLGTPTDALLTITNQVQVSASISTNSVSEGGGATFTLTADANVPTNTTINYTMSGSAVSGTNYSALSGSATILSGQNHVDIPISTISLAGVQPSLTATINISASLNYRVGSPASATLTILDTSLPPTPSPANILITP